MSIPGRLAKSLCASALLCFVASFPFHALAETWKSSVQLNPEKSTGAGCSQIDLSRLFWDLSLDGNTLSGVSTAGAKFSATVTPDGTVNTTFTSQTAGVGQYPVELTGNVKTRQFELLNRNARCTFKWVPVQ